MGGDSNIPPDEYPGLTEAEEQRFLLLRSYRWWIRRSLDAYKLIIAAVLYMYIHTVYSHGST